MVSAQQSFYIIIYKPQKSNINSAPADKKMIINKGGGNTYFSEFLFFYVLLALNCETLYDVKKRNVTK